MPLPSKRCLQHLKNPLSKFFAIFPLLLRAAITHLPILGCIALCLDALEAVDGGGEHGEVVAALARQQLGVQQAPHLSVKDDSQF